MKLLLSRRALVAAALLPGCSNKGYREQVVQLDRQPEPNAFARTLLDMSTRLVQIGSPSTRNRPFGPLKNVEPKDLPPFKDQVRKVAEAAVSEGDQTFGEGLEKVRDNLYALENTRSFVTTQRAAVADPLRSRDDRLTALIGLSEKLNRHSVVGYFGDAMNRFTKDDLDRAETAVNLAVENFQLAPAGPDALQSSGESSGRR